MQGKPYSEMTEQERKDWFGLAFKRTNPQDVPEAYICRAIPNQYGSGYGVVSREYDPENIYDINELKQYLTDYPEMDCIGWIKPLTPWQRKLKAIRTTWTSLTSSKIKEMLFSSQLNKFVEDDLWNCDSDEYIITWSDEHITCDRASELANQYDGDDDTKAAEVRTLRNAGKNYFRQMAEAFYEAHHDHPEPPVFPVEYIND